MQAAAVAGERGVRSGAVRQVLLRQLCDSVLLLLRRAEGRAAPLQRLGGATAAAACSIRFRSGPPHGAGRSQPHSCGARAVAGVLAALPGLGRSRPAARRRRREQRAQPAGRQVRHLPRAQPCHARASRAHPVRQRSRSRSQARSRPQANQLFQPGDSAALAPMRCSARRSRRRASRMHASTPGCSRACCSKCCQGCASTATCFASAAWFCSPWRRQLRYPKPMSRRQRLQKQLKRAGMFRRRSRCRGSTARQLLSAATSSLRRRTPRSARPVRRSSGQAVKCELRNTQSAESVPCA